MIQRAVQGMAQATRERERSLPLLTVSMPSDSSEIDSTNALTVSPSPQTAAPTSQPKAAVAKPAVNTGVPGPHRRFLLVRDLYMGGQTECVAHLFGYGWELVSQGN